MSFALRLSGIVCNSCEGFHVLRDVENLTQRMKCLLSLREFDAQNVHFACVNLKQMMIPDGESQLWI